MPPGDFLKTLIQHATRDQVSHGLDCKAFRLWMNEIGWRGCWRERCRVLARIRQQGAVEGYSTTWPSLAGHTTIGLLSMLVRYFTRNNLLKAFRIPDES